MSAIVTLPLSCGATLLVEPMAGVASAGLTWLVPCGCATDPQGREGLSAMLAELLLRGAGRLDSRAHADALDRLGVDRGTEVGTHNLRLSAAMVGDRLDQALPLLVDMVLRPRLEAEAVEPVRDLCLQAIESLADDPAQRAAIAARARHYPPPLNRSTLGTTEGLSAISRTDLVEGWARRARPVGSIIAIAGAVEPEELHRRFETLLAGWSGAARETVGVGTPPRGYAHEADESNQVQILVLHDAPRDGDQRSMEERLAIDVLSGGMSARLFTEVREKRGLCYSVSASYSPDKHDGRVVAYVGTTPERAQDSLDVLWAELQRLNTSQGAVTREEFQRSVVRMKSRLVFSGESTSARAASLAADQHRLGRPRSLGELASMIDALTLDRVNGYLARRGMGRVTIQTLGPAPLRPPAGAA